MIVHTKHLRRIKSEETSRILIAIAVLRLYGDPNPLNVIGFHRGHITTLLNKLIKEEPDVEHGLQDTFTRLLGPDCIKANIQVSDAYTDKPTHYIPVRKVNGLWRICTRAIRAIRRDVSFGVLFNWPRLTDPRQAATTAPKLSAHGIEAVTPILNTLMEDPMWQHHLSVAIEIVRLYSVHNKRVGVWLNLRRKASVTFNDSEPWYIKPYPISMGCVRNTPMPSRGAVVVARHDGIFARILPPDQESLVDQSASLPEFLHPLFVEGLLPYLGISDGKYCTIFTISLDDENNPALVEVVTRKEQDCAVFPFVKMRHGVLTIDNLLLMTIIYNWLLRFQGPAMVPVFDLIKLAWGSIETMRVTFAAQGLNYDDEEWGMILAKAGGV